MFSLVDRIFLFFHCYVLFFNILGIKFRAKFIQKQCENLLVNIYEKSNQAKQPEQIRFEYIQFLAKRFNEQHDEEKKIESICEKIERMQYEFYQKLGMIID